MIIMMPDIKWFVKFEKNIYLKRLFISYKTVYI
jgi:hypothetical protein